MALKLEKFDPELPEIIYAMEQVFEKTPNAIGLAANQINVTKRVIMIKTKSLNVVMVNPVLKKASKQTCNSIEMCLSVPGAKVQVKRHKQIVVEYQDRVYNTHRVKLRGLDSMCVPHELLHLDGVTLKHMVETGFGVQV